MAIDKTALDGTKGLVKSHEVTDTSERTTMRSAKDIMGIDTIVKQEEVACNESKLSNLYRNMMPFRVSRVRYRS